MSDVLVREESATHATVLSRSARFPECRVRWLDVAPGYAADYLRKRVGFSGRDIRKWRLAMADRSEPEWYHSKPEALARSGALWNATPAGYTKLRAAYALARG